MQACLGRNGATGIDQSTCRRSRALRAGQEGARQTAATCGWGTRGAHCTCEVIEVPTYDVSGAILPACRRGLAAPGTHPGARGAYVSVLRGVLRTVVGHGTATSSAAWPGLASTPPPEPPPRGPCAHARPVDCACRRSDAPEPAWAQPVRAGQGTLAAAAGRRAVKTDLLRAATCGASAMSRTSLCSRRKRAFFVWVSARCTTTTSTRGCSMATACLQTCKGPSQTGVRRLRSWWCCTRLCCP